MNVLHGEVDFSRLAFITSRFGYCLMLWTCHGRKIDKKINNLHERALRPVNKDRQLTFEELITRNKSVSVHHKILQILITEMYKVQHGITTDMNDIFRKRKRTRNARNSSGFETKNIKSVHNAIRLFGDHDAILQVGQSRKSAVSKAVKLVLWF